MSMWEALAASQRGFLFGQNCLCSSDRNPEPDVLEQEGGAWFVIAGRWLHGSEEVTWA